MPRNLESKKQIVSEIQKKFSEAQAVVVVDYLGLTVEQANELRKRTREAGIDYKVYKNTLTRLAAKETPFEPLLKDLMGPNAIAFGYDDPIMPAKILNDFSKDFKKLKLKAGIVEGEYYDQEQIKVVAEIPPREVLLAKFLGSIQSPLSKFAYLLKGIADQKENTTEA